MAVMTDQADLALTVQYDWSVVVPTVSVPVATCPDNDTTPVPCISYTTCTAKIAAHMITRCSAIAQRLRDQ